MVKELVLEKANVNMRDAAGRSPLLLAIAMEKVNSQCLTKYTRSLVDYLIAVGAEVGKSDQNGRNAFHYVIKSQDLEKLRIMCGKGASTSPTSSSTTASSMSSQNKQKQAQQFQKDQTNVVLAGAKTALNAGDNSGITPLAFAASQGYDDAVELLLHASANVNGASCSGIQPLHWAIMRRSLSTCMLLVNMKADLYKVTDAGNHNAQLDVEQLSPLGVAARCGFSHMLKFLLQDARIPFVFGAPRASTGVADADIPIVLRFAPPTVVNKYQNDLNSFRTKQEKQRQQDLQREVEQPYVFDGKKMIAVPKNASYLAEVDKMEEQRRKTRNTRACALLATSEQDGFQQVNIAAFTEKRLKMMSEDFDEKNSIDDENNNETVSKSFQAVPMPDFATAHKDHQDALERFVTQRQHRVGDSNSDPHLDFVHPTMLVSDSEHSIAIESRREKYRARLLNTLDRDTARFYMDNMLHATKKSAYYDQDNDNDDDDDEEHDIDDDSEEDESSGEYDEKPYCSQK